jgi:cbb3-type cytochrome oxidase subunit 3
MKFINYLESITGISIYPLFSLLVFFTFFVALTWYVVRADKKHIRAMKEIPLRENGGTEQDQNV